ncbi:MAG TPA: nitroreductase/quinone reductase family protein [Solirubrobacterales bacterium]|nr:nitroreductase/quinone reductase family protein [Solirubrobacterales bacterium]
MAVRPYTPSVDRGLTLALLERLFKTPVGTWTAINVGQRVDPPLMRLTRGRLRVGFIAPTVVLTHTGARSGKRRNTPLLYFTDGDEVVLVASKGGAASHPAWYHNVKANPEVEACSDGRPQPYLAREAAGEERERLWKLATTLYDGYDLYQEKAREHRTIPVVVLTPR